MSLGGPKTQVGDHTKRGSKGQRNRPRFGAFFPRFSAYFWGFHGLLDLRSQPALKEARIWKKSPDRSGPFVQISGRLWSI